MGIGLRDAHAAEFARTRPAVDFIEVITENVLVDAQKQAQLLELRAQYPLHLHGLSMNLASTDPLDRRLLKALRELTRQLEPFAVSDHLCFTAVDGRHSFDLLPFPFTRAMVQHVVDRLDAVQTLLGRPMVIENTTTYLRFEADELSEFDFIAQVLERSGAKLLFDVNNLYVTAHNHQFDPLVELAKVNPDSVAAYHLAGHVRGERGLLLDTHDRRVTSKVWALFEKAVQHVGPRPATLEWDDRLPSLATLVAEAEKMRPVFEREALARAS